MKVIGITGGVGCGKSTVLDFLKETLNCRIVMADDVARSLEEPGGGCYDQVLSLLEEAGRPGDGPLVLLKEDGFDRAEAARRLYRDPLLRKKINALVHPAVIRYICDAIEEERKEERFDYFFLEAALLIENGFLKLVDEMWYIYCSKEERTERLKSGRGYSDEKIKAIMKTQLSDEEFRRNCTFMIDNSGTPEETKAQIREHLRQVNK